MPIAKTNIHSITLRHQIVERIREAILNGSLCPGERVVERTLATDIGTSVTAVREALIQLESEGLITKRSNSTTNITSLTREEIAQTFAVRYNLERMAVEQAAQNATTAKARQLRRLHELALKAASGKDPRLYVQRDFTWHLTLWQASGNDVLVSTLRRLVLPLFGFSIIQAVSQPSFDLVEDARLHRPILEAVERNDTESAIRAFEDANRTWMTQVLEHPAGKDGASPSRQAVAGL